MWSPNIHATHSGFWAQGKVLAGGRDQSDPGAALGWSARSLLHGRGPVGLTLSSERSALFEPQMPGIGSSHRSGS